MRAPPLSLCVLVLALVGGGGARGLEPGDAWESFGRDQGLSGSSVTAIVQDRTGFLWLATQSGLNRWDGYTMRVWQKQPFSRNSLSHNLIQTMFLDGAVLWLGTYGGLDRFDTKTETFTAYQHSDAADSLSHNVVTRVYRDHTGTLWVGTLDGLNRLEPSGRFRRYLFEDGRGLAGKTVRTLVEDDSGRLWVGTSGGLNLYDRARDRLVTLAEAFPGRSLPEGAVMASLRGPGQGHLWLAVWGAGLVSLDTSTGASTVSPLSDDRLFGLDPGPGGTLLVGTWGGGLVVFDPASGRQFAFRHDPQRPDSLAHDVVYQAYQDRSGLLWVATNGGAVSRFNPRRGQFQFRPTLGKVPLVRETPDGALWLGVYNRGLTRIAPDGTSRTWKHGPGSRSLANDIVNGLRGGPRGELWILTNGGISVLDPTTGVLSRWRSPQAWSQDEVVNDLWIDTRGRWWFATYRSGLVRRDGPQAQAAEHQYLSGGPGSLPDDLVYFVREDSRGRLWVGTNGGLGLYRPETDDFRVWKYDPDDAQSLPSDTVRDLLEDSQGRLWVVCNGGGLVRLDPDTGALHSYGTAEGLSNLSVFSALEDDSGLLWISSANGLFAFRPENQTFRRYDTSDGLVSAEFSSGAVRRADGRLVFGSLQGVVSLVPRQLGMEDSPPPVALTNLQVLGSPRPLADEVVLGWQENAVTFGFSALDFRNPAKNLYAYQLEGFDRQWVQSGTRHEVTYTNLWPGLYRFRFRGANPSEVWAESPQSVVVRVEAAPWASWYAWLFYFALLGTTTYLFLRARESLALGQKVSELEVLRARLEEANDRLDRLARLDGLTGIPNRRALDAWLAEEWSRSSREGRPVAALMIDIDEFKRYNDFYGHLAGDGCLKSVAQTLAEGLPRNSDFCARYGGEEFVVVLHDTDEEGATQVALRLMEAVAALAIRHEVTGPGVVTLSVGLAALVPNPGLPAAELLQKADQGLYRAKALGRNRLEFG